MQKFHQWPEHRQHLEAYYTRSWTGRAFLDKTYRLLIPLSPTASTAARLLCRATMRYPVFLQKSNVYSEGKPCLAIPQTSRIHLFFFYTIIRNNWNLVTLPLRQPLSSTDRSHWLDHPPCAEPSEKLPQTCDLLPSPHRRSSSNCQSRTHVTIVQWLNVYVTKIQSTTVHTMTQCNNSHYTVKIIRIVKNIQQIHTLGFCKTSLIFQ